MNRKLYTLTGSISLLFFVFTRSVFAAPVSFFNYITATNGILNLAIPVVIGLAMILFLWGTARFFFSGGDEKRLEDVKRLMVWGIVTLFVMVAVWGIIDLVQTEFFGGWRLYQVLPGGP